MREAMVAVGLEHDQIRVDLRRHLVDPFARPLSVAKRV
jgi:hypothetical protein